jgi:AbrB family looped-hinge helix DNA binding protein
MLSKVYGKGQIVIPIGIRKKYNIEIGDIVEIEDKEDYLVIKPVRKTSLMDLGGCIDSDKPFPTRDTIKRIVQEEMARDETDRY